MGSLLSGGWKMPNYAMYQTDVIVNVIIADTKEIAQAVTGLSAIETSGEPWIGWLWDEAAQSWVAPPEPEPEPESEVEE